MSEEKQDQVLDHDYDGIQEYDNRLPTWWLAILYATIVFAFFYWSYHFTLGGPTPQDRYRGELVAAAEAELARMEGQELNNETLFTMASVPTQVEAGRAIFQQFCVVCHADQAQGNVGPNLTDGYWLHGGRPMDILHTVTNGVPDKGMVAWGNQLGPRRVQQVVSYILSLRNTNVPGKDPQGEKVGPRGEPLDAEGNPIPAEEPETGAPSGDGTGTDMTSPGEEG